MIDLDFKKAVEQEIGRQGEKRVIHFVYEGQDYFIKRRISNHRNAFAKQSVDEAFFCEVYKIMTVNQYFPLAPEIVLLDQDYFVMKSDGASLQAVAKEAPWQECRLDAFRKAGEGLARLHEAGLHHGRPALRDIAYNKETGRITFLDWENEKRFIKEDPRVIDFVLFIHGMFREKWHGGELLETAMKGYLASPAGREILRQAKALIHDHRKIFLLCNRLRGFGWKDVNSLDDARAYIMGDEKKGAYDEFWGTS